MMQAISINFDGIVGPTHNYAGLSWGNLASMKHKKSVSNPKQAALEGLAKMKFLHDLGIRQAVLPPHDRPDVAMLRRLGFVGSDADVLAAAQKTDPVLLAGVSSASAMWAANAATVSPSADCADRKLHFTPANLVSTFHRSLESPTTSAVLKAIFQDESHFVHHPPLPANAMFADEGAANQIRLSGEINGLEIFVFGREGLDNVGRKFPARQTLAACQAIARCHHCAPNQMFFVRQNPAAIDAGAFHNDVVAVGHGNVLLMHELAWVDQKNQLDRLRENFAAICGGDLHVIEIANDLLPLADAITTYLFNSQIVSLPNGSIALIAPVECRETPAAQNAIATIVAGSNPITEVHFVDVRQSMHNGGGPACLRLNVSLTPQELDAMQQSILFDNRLYDELRNWVNEHYRDRLAGDDLADPELLAESRVALDALTHILKLGAIYAFQRP